jgi:hypothetical protein
MRRPVRGKWVHLFFLVLSPAEATVDTLPSALSVSDSRSCKLGVLVSAGAATCLSTLLRSIRSKRAISGMTHVRTSPYYRQSNGKIEGWQKSLKGECIRPGTPLSLEDARRLVEGYVEHYNNVRLNSGIGYITPKDMLAGHQQEIQAERDRKLDAAKEQRKNRRQGAA